MSVLPLHHKFHKGKDYIPALLLTIYLTPSTEFHTQWALNKYWMDYTERMNKIINDLSLNMSLFNATHRGLYTRY